MCQNLVCVANMTRNRYITLCEHYPIYVHWDNLALSWSLNDYNKVANTIMHQLQTQNIPEPSVVIKINQVLAGWPTSEFYLFADTVLFGFLIWKTR